ncbi:hypothetical protein FS749_013981 [Ceratobasidium sp. UAMH 11750]|nr:hypothetical protein FS749_013981 [Ceratobasidium sp. UAMH 11750]
MVFYFNVLILGGSKVFAIGINTWSDIPTISALEYVMRHEVGALNGKEFNMYKADLSAAEAKEIEMFDINDSRFRRLDEWFESPAEPWPNGFEPGRVHILVELVLGAFTLSNYQLFSSFYPKPPNHQRRIHNPCLNASGTPVKVSLPRY